MKTPTPVIVHLSGARRGVTERLSGDRLRVGAAENAEIRIPSTDFPEGVLPEPGDPVATLERRGESYELKAGPESGVQVNGKKVEYVILDSGDVLKLGEDGPVLRFRVYRPGKRPAKSLGEAVEDCVDCARYGSTNLLRRAAILLWGAPRELVTQTSRLFRLSVFLLLAVLLVVAGYLWRENRRLSAETAQIAGLAELMGRNNVTAGDLGVARTEIEGRLSDTLARVEALESRLGARSRVIAAAVPSVIFLQGAYGFLEPESDQPLRFHGTGPDGMPLTGPEGQTAVTTKGDGPVVEILYTGTAFLVTEEGYLLTNRHVAMPWSFDPAAQQIVGRGFVPVMRRFIGYMPGVEEPFPVELIRRSETADVALLKCTEPPPGARPLPLGGTPPRVGDEVIVLGYPTGIRALLARTDPAFIRGVMETEGIDFWSLARELSAGGHIAPLATVGVIGQVSDSTVVYDAETTHGGSGGPVLGLDGIVVAVNAAVLPEFGGSNLGVPAAEAARLMAPPESPGEPEESSHPAP